ncbi:IS110 family transposase [Gordonia humi]|uniref:Transposase n=1 Tax=Gordonia humi TaxID=686429 RepID=A0A840EUJ8_9ACTN|nr:IS110 family transposase [Gordonia humi]MBB4134014.1 transposase [Gordonia humi]
MITCGIDWAEDHHDIALMDDSGFIIERRRITHDPNGFAELLAMVADHGGTADDVPIAIETDKNLLVVALAGAGFTVYPINPRAVARYRERHGQAGNKSDSRDAAVLADIVRTDRHQHRRLPANSEQQQAIKALARQHQEAIWAQNQTISRLRSVLLEFYPQALQAFPKLKHRAAMEVLSIAPTPTDAAKLTRPRISNALKRVGRRNDPALVTQIHSDLHAPGLRQPDAVEVALGHTVASLVAIIVAMLDAVAVLERELVTAFAEHPQADIIDSVPGLGGVLGARILAEIGDDPTRFSSPTGLRSFAGTAPVTIASGRSHYVKARKVRNRRLADACHWWAFAALTWSAPAREYYDHRRAVGDHHNAALRALANKLLGRLWWCLQHDQSWDDTAAWPRAATPAAA